MALDLYQLAKDFPQDELLEKAEAAHRLGWVTCTSDRRTLTLLSCGEHNHFPRDDGSSIYEKLERRGILCVAGPVQDNLVLLNGGSVSSCHLLLRERKVVKSVGPSIVGPVDGRERHAAEAHWLIAADMNWPGLFPKPLSVNSGETVQVTFEFVPAYTLGELLVQGRLSLIAAQRILAATIENLGRTLYCQVAAGGAERYPEKVERRLDMLLNLNELTPDLERLYVSGAMINGLYCRPIRDQLALLTSEPRLSQLVECHLPRMCHGDLIPENILHSPFTARTILVDPNAQVRDPLCDLGKLAMSFAVCYDAALRDGVSIEWNENDGGWNLSLSVDSGWSGVCSSQLRLLEWLLGSVDALVSTKAVEPVRRRREAVMLLAGLQAMAITSFHALHHRKTCRAVYFLAMGQRMLEETLRSLGH